MDVSPTHGLPRPSASFARLTWEATINPTARKVSEILKAAGYDLPWRTLHRWRKLDWYGAMPLEEGEARALSEITAAVLSAEYHGINGTAIGKAIHGTVTDVKAVEDRLKDCSREELVDEAIMTFTRNLIVSAETAMQKIDLLVGAMPKEYAALLAAQAEGLVQMHNLTNKGAKLVAVNATGSNGKHMNGELLAPEVENPMSAIARKFRQAADKVSA